MSWWLVPVKNALFNLAVGKPNRAAKPNQHDKLKANPNDKDSGVGVKFHSESLFQGARSTSQVPRRTHGNNHGSRYETGAQQTPRTAYTCGRLVSWMFLGTGICL
jgi:hypothetical protein